MAFELVRMQKSLVAGESFATKQFTFVRIGTGGKIYASAAGAYAVGVVQDKPLTDQPGSVCGPGDTTKIQCGGSFVAGDYLASDGNGKAVTASTSDAILGEALLDGADGEVSTMLFQPRGTL